MAVGQWDVGRKEAGWGGHGHMWCLLRCAVLCCALFYAVHCRSAGAPVAELDMGMRGALVLGRAGLGWAGWGVTEPLLCCAVQTCRCRGC